MCIASNGPLKPTAIRKRVIDMSNTDGTSSRYNNTYNKHQASIEKFKPTIFPHRIQVQAFFKNIYIFFSNQV